jgi:predicted ATPase
LEVGSEIALYRLHETTRAYAIEKLSESGELGDVARRHADYYRDLLERAEAELETLPAPAWLAVYGHQIGQVCE